MEQQLVNLLMYTLPALITGAIAYLFFKAHVTNETNRRDFLITKDLQKESFPLRLQAYERMALFSERINPSKLLIRVKPLSANKDDYETLLIANIEQEFEHNLSQQIYVSNECWSIITTTKNATIQLIRTANMNEKTDSAEKLQEVILTALMDKETPSSVALSYIRNEVSKMW
ncbi:MAG: hypothetical protein ACPGUH_00925 [Winogradskyella sp.]